MGNKYMKPNQSIDDLCDQNLKIGLQLHDKRSSKSTETLPTRLYLAKSQRYKFLTQSYRKRSALSKMATTERVQVKSTFESEDPNLRAQNLGFVIFKNESFDIAKAKYCHKICTSTPKNRRFDALEEFEKVYRMNLNGYGSDVSSISQCSLFSGDDKKTWFNSDKKYVANNSLESQVPEGDCARKYKKNKKPLRNSLLRYFEERGAITIPPDNKERGGRHLNFEDGGGKNTFDTKRKSSSSLLNLSKPLPGFINIIIIGDQGVGKTTLIHSLLQSKGGEGVTQCLSPINIYKTTLVRCHRRLEVMIVDTPGLDVESQGRSGTSIVEEFIVKSSKNDQRILHCCLYCISPFLNNLRPSDLSFMKKLAPLVNIVPVIMKIDCLSLSETQVLKKSLKNSLEHNQINIYQLPRSCESQERQFRFVNDNVKKILPFATIGSRDLLETDEGVIRGRKYPWGIINVDNPVHCDMYWLRKFIFESHCADLVYTSRVQLVRRAEVLTGKTFTL